LHYCTAYQIIYAYGHLVGGACSFILKSERLGEFKLLLVSHLISQAAAILAFIVFVKVPLVCAILVGSFGDCGL
jgi:hypothetical protein